MRRCWRCSRPCCSAPDAPRRSSRSGPAGAASRSRATTRSRTSPTASRSRASSDFTTEWHGATWRFASAAHRDQFVADPEKFAPQFGGYCAWAVSQNKTAGIDPEAWKIVDGKLYLNYSKDIQAKWEQDVPGNIGKAEANWPKLLGAH